MNLKTTYSIKRSKYSFTTNFYYRTTKNYKYKNPIYIINVIRRHTMIIIDWIRRKNTKNAYIEFEKVVRCGEPCYEVLTFKNFPKIDDCTKEYLQSNTHVFERYYKLVNFDQVPVLTIYIHIEDFEFCKEIGKGTVITKQEYELLERWIPIALTKFENVSKIKKQHHGKFTVYFEPYVSMVSEFEEWF